MRLRASSYLWYARLRGRQFGKLLQEFERQLATGNDRSACAAGIFHLLEHCRREVPYYSRLLDERALTNAMVEADPVGAIRRLPLLTKDVIRKHDRELRSRDLDRRRHYVNTSGGSTGDPVRLVQDADYFDRTFAVTLLFSALVGRRLGDPEVRLWGSERDVLAGTIGWKARFFNRWTNTSLVNAFRMTPNHMRTVLHDVSARPPHLLVAYAQAAYELAGFAEREGIRVSPQRAIMTSAGTLHPFMRERIERVFGCRVYDRYGSREVGDIACERPGVAGRWIPPWTCHVEVVGEDGVPVADGVEGEIVVSSLANYAMPLIRYRIGDRGALGWSGGERVLTRISGRNVDAFRKEDGSIVDGEYFTHLLYFKPWVGRFQIVQRAYDHIVVRVALAGPPPDIAEQAEIAEKCRTAMGPACRIEFELVTSIPELPSGKYRYTISEVAP